MFNKKFEREYRNNYYKGYSSDSSIYEVINIIMNSDISFKSVTLSDRGDVGLKYFGGEYSYEKFCIIYEDIKSDIDTLSFNFLDNSGSIEVSISDKTIILVTNNINLDINDLLKKSISLVM